MLAEIADRPKVKHVVLVMDSVSLIDASALETLEQLILAYRDAGVLIHLASVKGPLDGHAGALALFEPSISW